MADARNYHIDNDDEYLPPLYLSALVDNLLNGNFTYEDVDERDLSEKEEPNHNHITLESFEAPLSEDFLSETYSSKDDPSKNELNQKKGATSTLLENVDNLQPKENNNQTINVTLQTTQPKRNNIKKTILITPKMLQENNYQYPKTDCWLDATEKQALMIHLHSRRVGLWRDNVFEEVQWVIKGKTKIASFRYKDSVEVNGKKITFETLKRRVYRNLNTLKAISEEDKDSLFLQAYGTGFKIKLVSCNTFIEVKSDNTTKEEKESQISAAMKLHQTFFVPYVSLAPLSTIPLASLSVLSSPPPTIHKRAIQAANPSQDNKHQSPAKKRRYG